MPLNCKTCGAPLKGDEEHCPYCGSFIEYENRPQKQKSEHEHKNSPQIKYASEIFIIIVSIFTFGIYGIYWYFSRRKSLNGLVDGVKFPDIGFVIYVIGWLMFFFLTADDPDLADPEEGGLAYIGSIVIWIGAAWMSFAIQKILKKYLVEHCADEAILKVINFSDIMTFIFGYIYLQIQINKMIQAEIFSPQL